MVNDNSIIPNDTMGIYLATCIRTVEVLRTFGYSVKNSFYGAFSEKIFK